MTYSQNKQRAILTWAALVALLIYAGFKGYEWWLRNEPLGSAANKIITAFEQEDSGTLWHYSDLGEQEAFQLDKKRFDRVLRSYVWPTTRQAKKKRVIREGHPKEGVYLITAYYEFDNREVFLDLVVFDTKMGPRTNIITPAVFTVFNCKYGGMHRDLSGAAKWYATRLEGSVRDRKSLEQLGVTGIKDSAPELAMIPWKDHDKILNSYLVSKGYSPITGR